MPPSQLATLAKPIHIRFNGEQVVLPKAVRQKIDAHWAQLVHDNPHLYNGEAFTVIDVQETDAAMDVMLAETNYAHYLYCHEIGGLGDYDVRIIHPAALVITADNILIIGAMGAHTSRPGVIQCSGGGIDHKDITGGVVDAEYGTARELAEELGIDAYDKTRVQQFQPAFIWKGGPLDVITIIYTVQLTQTAEAFRKDYEAFTAQLAQRGEEPEFGQLHYIKADTPSVKAFIQKHGALLHEYVPDLLRRAAG